MGLRSIPTPQRNHNYINTKIECWADIHFGDTSFNGRVMVGRKKAFGGVLPLRGVLLTHLKPYLTNMHASEKIDYYITANTMKGNTRRETELFGLQNIVFDIDCHDKNIGIREKQRLVQTFIWRFKRDLVDTGALPEPNSIVTTGQGVQLWWAIKPCYGGEGVNCRSFYDQAKAIMLEHITDMLNDYDEELQGLELDHATSNNPVGYYRMPCTLHTKAGIYGALEILHEKKYDVCELARTLERTERKPYIVRPQEAQIPFMETDIELLQGFHSAGLRRVLQLTKLRNYRNNKVGEETRNYLNFAVYNALRMSFDHTEAEARLRAYNAGFKEPMTEKELKATICTAKKKDGYKYSNAKLIELLVITPEEQRAIGLYPYSGSYRTERKPNASRDEARRALRDTRDRKILELHQEGVSQAETARRLGIGKNTVGRVLKKYRDGQAVPAAPVPQIALQKAQKKRKEKRHQNGSIYDLRNIKASMGGASATLERYAQLDAASILFGGASGGGILPFDRKKFPDDS